jgi:hypothetical protein
MLKWWRDVRFGLHMLARHERCTAVFILLCRVTTATGQMHPDSSSPLFKLQVVDLSRKFLDFYDAAVRTHATPDERWKLWKEKYDYAGVPPIPAGQRMARQRLDAAWPKYPAAIARIRYWAAALTPPGKVLDEVATLLGAEQPIRIRLIAFAGTFQRNAFASGLKNGVSTISIPLEDSDQDHALDMTHEFTHAVRMQMGSWEGQSVASQIFAERLAMRVTQRLNPGFPASVYTTSSPGWMTQCEDQLPAVLADLKEHLSEEGAEAVSRFTVAKGAAGIRREIYWCGWFVVGKILTQRVTFPQLARLPESQADLQVAATINLLLASSSAASH